MRKLIHIDADCFYAAIEERDNPKLRGKAIAVGGSAEGRGVIATCSYAARRHGVRSAMSSAVAKRLCPELEIIRPNIKKYKAASREIMAILEDYSDCFEPLSLDEAYLDVTNATRCAGSATLIAKEVRARVQRDVGITVSAGIAPVKFLAKVASDWLKPDGLFVILPHQVESFTSTLRVSLLPGVGPATLKRLHRHGLYVCQHIRDFGEQAMERELGQFGVALYRRAWGQDTRLVGNAGNASTRKSVSVERTFASDLLPGQLAPALVDLQHQLVTRLMSRSQIEGLSRLFVKVKADDFRQTTVEAGIPESIKATWIRELTGTPQPPKPPESTSVFIQYQRLCSTAWGRLKRPIRLIGLGVGLKPVADRLRERSIQLPLCQDW